MTKKRFTIKDSILNEGYVIIDNEKEYTFSVLDRACNHMFCKALNELHEENENLKQQIRDLRGNVLDSIHEADEIRCTCNPCVVEECVKKVMWNE